MEKKVFVFLFIFLLLSTSGIAQTNQQIQIFDIDQDKVIKYVQSNADVQQEVENILKGITGVYAKYNPIPTKGFMVRIPLEPNIMIRNKWFDDLVDEVTIILPSQEDPYLMLFDDENKPFFLTFEGNTEKLLDLLDFKP
ncbi:hypothetical protein ACFSFW_11045 [Fredinandcohnia salidurans]|uniref:Group-specific protein n=1 Tax=Fredinandcohnia salidurans TaxID=2595041 RepID=A0ABW4MMU3_9BACI|nr:hypothetical protein [Fredinandcohnia onubensis]